MSSGRSSDSADFVFLFRDCEGTFATDEFIDKNGMEDGTNVKLDCSGYEREAIGEELACSTSMLNEGEPNNSSVSMDTGDRENCTKEGVE